MKPNPRSFGAGQNLPDVYRSLALVLLHTSESYTTKRRTSSQRPVNYVIFENVRRVYWIICLANLRTRILKSLRKHSTTSSTNRNTHATRAQSCRSSHSTSSRNTTVGRCIRDTIRILRMQDDCATQRRERDSLRSGSRWRLRPVIRSARSKRRSRSLATFAATVGFLE